MRPAKIKLTVLQGNFPEKAYVFEQPVRCIIGRAEDCDIQVPADYHHMDVSRHHCCLDVRATAVQVRDLGSLNGTYLNGLNVGHRAEHLLAEEADLSEFAAYEVKNGDELRVGHAIFRVGIVASRDFLLAADCL